MAEEKHHFGLFHHKEETPEERAAKEKEKEIYEKYKEEEEKHKHKEHKGEEIAAAAGAFVLVFIIILWIRFWLQNSLPLKIILIFLR